MSSQSTSDTFSYMFLQLKCVGRIITKGFSLYTAQRSLCGGRRRTSDCHPGAGDSSPDDPAAAESVGGQIQGKGVSERFQLSMRMSFILCAIVYAARLKSLSLSHMWCT